MPFEGFFQVGQRSRGLDNFSLDNLQFSMRRKRLLKTLWEKEKLYVGIIFNTFYLVTQLKSFPNKPWFLRVCSTSLLKTLGEKEKLLITSNFSFFHSVFCLAGELSAIFIKSEMPTLSVWKCLKFIIWERVKCFPHNRDSYTPITLRPRSLRIATN